MESHRAGTARLQTLIVAAQLAAERRCGVDDDDRRAPAVRVDVDEPVDADLEPGLLARLANRGARDLLAAIDVAAGEHPQSVSRLDRPAHQHELLVRGADDRADGDLRDRGRRRCRTPCRRDVRARSPSAGASRGDRRRTGRSGRRPVPSLTNIIPLWRFSRSRAWAIRCSGRGRGRSIRRRSARRGFSS